MSPEFALGTVLAVHPERFSYDVAVTSGGVLFDVGVMNATGGPFSTDINPIPNMLGAVVALMHVYQDWVILGTIPVHREPEATIAPSITNTGTGSDNEDTYGGTLGAGEDASYANGRTGSFLSSDKVISADGGSELLLGAEGLAVLKASPLAQLILGGFKDFAKIIAREFSIYTDFGTIEFSGGGPTGTTGMSILGGSTFCDESGTTDPIYTVKIYAGDVPGDPLARFALYVYSASMEESVHLIVDNQGTITIDTTKDLSKEIGRDCTENITEYRSVSVGIDNTEEVTGNESITVGGARNVSVASEYALNTGSLSISTGGLSFKCNSSDDYDGICTISCKSLNIVQVSDDGGGGSDDEEDDDSDDTDELIESIE